MAITPNNTSSGSSGPGTDVLTFSHTTSGSSRLLWIGVTTVDAVFAGTVSGITYGGVAMTKVTSANPQANMETSLWYLIDPASGANDVEITNVPGVFTDQILSLGMSYSITLQSGVPDSSASKTQTTTSITHSTTVSASDCWVLGYAFSASGTTTAGTGMTSRISANSSVIGDSNAIVTPGAYSMTASGSSADSMGIIMASFREGVAPSGNSNFFLVM